MATSVGTEDLDRLLQSWDHLLKQFPASKRKLLESLGEELLSDVRGRIGGTGKVAGWQAPHQGSGGGYVAVRPLADTYQTTKSGKRYAVGYVTNAIEGGHKHGRPRGGTAKGYRYRRGRMHIAAVPGRWFYQDAREALQRGVPPEKLAGLLEEIVDGLEGKL